MAIRPPTANSEKPGWMSRHKQKLREVGERKNDIDLVFIGDSITQAWEDKGKREWKKLFAPFGALNLGFGGDRTEHLLWRIEQGQLNQLTPKLLVLLIGTNNTGHCQDPPTDTAHAIIEIVDRIHFTLPTTHILLHAILPSGQFKTDLDRRINEEINHLIKPLSTRNYIDWLDLSHLFLDENGEILADIMNDYLHPNVFQYKRWADALIPEIKRLMQA